MCVSRCACAPRTKSAFPDVELVRDVGSEELLVEVGGVLVARADAHVVDAVEQGGEGAANREVRESAVRDEETVSEISYPVQVLLSVSKPSQLKPALSHPTLYERSLP